MRSVLIDSRGQAWHPADWYRAAAGDLSHADRIEDFAIRNVGCILVTLKSDTASVRLAPAKTAVPAALALMRLLEQERLSRFGLVWFFGRWNHEIFRDQDQLSKRILDLISQHTKQSEQRFLARERAIDTLPGDSELMRVCEMWRHFGGAIDLGCYDDTLHELLEGRFTVSVREDDTSRLVFTQVGRGYVMYNSDFASNAVGNRVDHQPDAIYGRWVANGFREAAIRNEPMLCDIDALVRSPGRPECRVTYARLTLPIEGMDRRSGLLSATLLDSRIDLRSGLLDQEAEHVVD